MFICMAMRRRFSAMRSRRARRVPSRCASVQRKVYTVLGVVTLLYPTPNGQSQPLFGLHPRYGLTGSRYRLEQKRWDMRILMNHIWRRRWENTYPVAPSAIKVVKVIEVQIRFASAKVGMGDTGSFDERVVRDADRAHMQQAWKGVWSGVLPLFEVLGTPAKRKDIGGRRRREGVEDCATAAGRKKREGAHLCREFGICRQMIK